MTSVGMVGTTGQHPEGYRPAEDSPGLWWGASIERDEYQLHPAYVEGEGHTVCLTAQELTPEGAAALAADLARWCSQVSE